MKTLQTLLLSLLLIGCSKEDLAPPKPPVTHTIAIYQMGQEIDRIDGCIYDPVWKMWTTPMGRELYESTDGRYIRVIK